MKKLFLVAAVVVYIVLHGAFELGLNAKRETIYEVDDEYHFLIKAQNTKECLGQDCPALLDLYDQTGFAPTDKEMANGQIQVRHRALIAYHPLHSYGILAIQKLTGWSLERSQMGLNVLLHAVAGVGVGLLLQGLFGSVAAGIGLLMLSAVWLNPSSWVMTPFLGATTLVLAAWGVLARDHFKGQMALALGLLAMACGFHTAGVVGTGMTVFWLAVADGRIRKDKLVFYGLALAVALFFFKWQMRFVPEYIDYKTIYAEAGILSALKENLWMLRTLMTPVTEQYGLPLLLLGLLVALVTLPGMRRRRLAAIALAGVGLVAFGLVYPSPYISVLHRLWHLVMVPLVGAVAYLLVWSARNATWPGILVIKDWFAGRTAPGRQVGLQAIAMGTLAVSGVTVLYALVFGGMQVPYAFKNMVAGKNVVFDFGTAEAALDVVPEGGRLVYDFAKPSLSSHAEELQEAVVYFALAHGLTDRGLALAPFLRKQPAELEARRSSLTHLLAVNPLVAMHGGDWMLGGQPLYVDWGEVQSVVQVYSMDGWDGRTLTFTDTAGRVTEVQGTGTGWLTLNLATPAVGGTLDMTGPQVRLGGMALGAQVPARMWPWESGLTLGWRHGGGYTAEGLMASAVFSLEAMSPLPGCTLQLPVTDAGSLVLAPLVCTKRADGAGQPLDAAAAEVQ